MTKYTQQSIPFRIRAGARTYNTLPRQRTYWLVLQLPELLTTMEDLVQPLSPPHYCYCNCY